MGVDGYFADTRSAYERENDNVVTCVIPAAIADELEIDGDTNPLFRMREGDDHATIENPERLSIEDSAHASQTDTSVGD
jgi:hypothetical protein